MFTCETNVNENTSMLHHPYFIGLLLNWYFPWLVMKMSVKGYVNKLKLDR